MNSDTESAAAHVEILTGVLAEEEANGKAQLDSLGNEVSALAAALRWALPILRAHTSHPKEADQ